MADRDDHIRRARVHLTEARRRRNMQSNRHFYWVLLRWAANCRRLAAACQTEQSQGDLFA